MRRAIIALVVCGTSLVPAALWANGDGMPPDAKRERAEAKGDPSKVTSADLAANAPDSYTVTKGDTLWSISGRFLKDPWKWPQVWQLNRDQIKNPHLIYPGDVIRLDRSGANPTLALERGGSGAGGGGPSGGTAADAAGNMQVVQPRIRVETLSTAVPSIPGTAIGPFLTQPLIVEADGLAMAPTILATEESRVVVGAGNTVYVDRIGERDGIAWQFFRKGEPLYDPETREILGYEAKYIGDGRVKRFGNPTTVEVTKASQEINRGDKLAPARETAFPSYVPRAPDKPIKGLIMSVDGGVAELGQYAVITINRGSRDGIEIGHVLATYKRGELVDDKGRPFELRTGYGSDWWASVRTWYRESIAEKTEAAPEGQSLEGQAIKLPDERNGIIFVFRVFEKMSYAIVMRASKPIYLGDVVQTP